MGALGRDRRLRISSADGYVSLNAYLPPVERRGLVLIDPPYEAAGRGEAGRGGAGARRWRNGRAASICCGGRSRARSTTRASSTRFARWARPTCSGWSSTSARSRPGPHSPAPLRRTGLLVVNPPFGFVEEARALMPYLTKLLTRGPASEFAIDWVTAPT